MRKVSLAIAMMAAAAVSACAHKDSADDDLAKDLAMASSSDGIALAPAAPSRSTVSAVEQIAPAHPRAAPSSRATAPRAARRPVRAVAKAEPAPAPAPVAEEPAPEPEEQPVTVAERPQPIPASQPADVGTGPVGGDGSGASRGPSTGEVIGAIIGAVIRGGTVGEDHCDPRTDGRHRPRISINSRVPVIVRAF